MAKFRDKPIFVEAVQYTGENAQELFDTFGAGLFSIRQEPKEVMLNLGTTKSLVHVGYWVCYNKELNQHLIYTNQAFMEYFEPVPDGISYNVDILPKDLYQTLSMAVYLIRAMGIYNYDWTVPHLDRIAKLQAVCVALSEISAEDKIQNTLHSDGQ